LINTLVFVLLLFFFGVMMSHMVVVAATVVQGIVVPVTLYILLRCTGHSKFVYFFDSPYFPPPPLFKFLIMNLDKSPAQLNCA